MIINIQLKLEINMVALAFVYMNIKIKHLKTYSFVNYSTIFKELFSDPSMGT